MLVGLLALVLLLALAWAISRINRRAGFGRLGTVLPFGALVLALAFFVFQGWAGLPTSQVTQTAVMSAVLLIWALQILWIAIWQWPALPDGTNAERQS